MVKISRNIPLSQYTTFEIGGKADFFIEVFSLQEMREAIDFAKELGKPYLIIGGGSNLLISDKGIRGVVIKNSVKGVEIKGNLLTAYSGELLQDLVELALKDSLSGLEFATGIPGTFGGAVVGNAGAYGKGIGDILLEGVILTKDGRFKKANRDYFKFEYRKSILKDTKEVLIKATLSLKKGKYEDIKKQMDKIKEERSRKHPPRNVRCAGSFFKNVTPEDSSQKRIAAGYLLDLVGAKDVKVGNAEVYQKHANFIINKGGAKCEDVIKLAQILKQRVKNKFGVLLEEEVVCLKEDLKKMAICIEEPF